MTREDKVATRKPDDIQWHELVDRARLFAGIVASELLGHSVTQSLGARDPIKKQLAKAVEVLNDAHQMIAGRVAEFGVAALQGKGGQSPSRAQQTELAQLAADFDRRPAAMSGGGFRAPC